MDADWVVGELRGKKGMFPASFVNKVPENLPKDSGGESSKVKTESPSKTHAQSSSKSPATTEKVADHRSYGFSFHYLA